MISVSFLIYNVFKANMHCYYMRHTLINLIIISDAPCTSMNGILGFIFIVLRGCPWKNQAEGGKGHDSDFDNFLCMRYYWDTCPNCKI